MAKFAIKPIVQVKKAPVMTPWGQDNTPRNGECNQGDGVFKILPNDGKKMHDWKWDDKHNKP